MIAIKAVDTSLKRDSIIQYSYHAKKNNKKERNE